jgi:hypothetical protein
MQSSEMLFRSVWENSVDGMRLSDAKGVIIAVNDALLQTGRDGGAGTLEGQAVHGGLCRVGKPKAGIARALHQRAVSDANRRALKVGAAKRVLHNGQTR